MATYYWVGGSGNWNTASSTNWSLTSGGSGGAGVPSSSDNVIFDLNSGNGTITASNGNCNNLSNISGTNGSFLVFSNGSTCNIYGSVSLSYLPSGGASFSLLSVTFKATSSSQTISTPTGTGFAFLTFYGNGGIWNFSTPYVSAGGITFYEGTINTNNNNITIAEFNYSNVGTSALNLGTSVITLNNGSGGNLWNIPSSTGLTLSAASSTIVYDSVSPSSPLAFYGGGLTYGTLSFGGSGWTNVSIYGNNTFSNLTSTITTFSYTIYFNNSSTNTITTWGITGNASYPVTIASSASTVTPAILSITNQTVGIDYLIFNTIKCSSLTPITFYVGVHSILEGPTYGILPSSAVAHQYVHILVSGTSWTTPSNWNNSNNQIHLFGGGGGGGGGRFVSSTSHAGGGGGGGGGYTKQANVAISGAITYAIGAGGASATANVAGGTGGNTTFSIYSAGGGGGGSTTTSPSSVGGTGGTGINFNGGAGGLGSASTTANQGEGGGGGGGSAGPLGAGATGGNGHSGTSAGGGTDGQPGGGGGNGGGSAGGNAPSNLIAGLGGNNSVSVGGGNASSLAFDGGGGGSSGNGGSGIDITGIGAGSGGGAVGGSDSALFFPGFFGGGGAGGYVGATAGFTSGIGSQGGIVIIYATGSGNISLSNFFIIF